MPPGLEIEVVYHDGCPHLLDTACELAKAFADLNYRGEVHVRHHRITTPEEANEVGFAGWPLVRVNGRGVTPEACARDSPRWAACHHYECPNGVQHYPSAAELKTAIEHALWEGRNT